ncbi:hypothetical protein K503DRAFT_805203 [Rhizopogon vinicolor AM-OR11-026]|uniref:Uncharacterized protein n=1 Tax=Rhizopogon vinicolor AM-OR11-026 TaxID=1314800 RepID=A0A1B7MIN7_9AGAM|nr:hypothetical protein K503DRAFT_805203 [Rhizopogon vinicolor AM-OR11-026]
MFTACLPPHILLDIRMASPSYLRTDVDATNPHGQSGTDEVNEEERKDLSQCSFEVTLNYDLCALIIDFSATPPRNVLMAIRSTSPSDTMQDARTLSQLPSLLDIDATSSRGQSGFDEINEEERNDPYQDFFQSSEPNLSSSPDPSPGRRCWKVLRLPINKSKRLQERLNRHFFARRVGGKDAKGTSTDNPHPRRFWNVFRTPINGSTRLQGFNNRGFFAHCVGRKDTAGGKDTLSINKAPAKIARDPSSEVVEIRAARGFRVSFSLLCTLSMFLLAMDAIENGCGEAGT